jgi:hypothetical protein
VKNSPLLRRAAFDPVLQHEGMISPDVQKAPPPKKLTDDLLRSNLEIMH